MNATSTFGNVSSYGVIQTKHKSKSFLVSKSLNSGSTNVLLISLALSGLRLKNITESWGSIFATGVSPLHITVGSINSSKISFWYDASTACIADEALFPTPLTIAS